MNRSLEVLKNIYKPYRYTIKGNVVILNTSMGDFVVKEKNDKDIKKLYSYLSSRSFTNYPELIDDSRRDANVYEYLDSVDMPNEQKALDLINLIGNLHNKTSFYKSVTEDTFKEIYENIKSNIDYLKLYYDNLYEDIKKEEYPSPSRYYLIRNISKIFASLEFCQSELDKWFSLVKNQTKKRVCLIHNNVSLEHFIKKDKEYLISWEHSRIDSPIIDLIEFYKSEYFNVSFDVLLSKYFDIVHLTDDEKKLFFILISLPKKIEFQESEFKSCESVRNIMDYLFITEELVRPYYAIEQEN